MKRILSLVVLIILIAVAPAAAAADAETGDTPPNSEIDDGTNHWLLSSGFIPNVGQCDGGVEYVLQHQGTTVFFTRDGLVLVHTPGSAGNTSGDVVRQSFVGASPEARLTASGQRTGVMNYYVGNDSSKWLSGIPVYSEVIYEDLYPGIDLVYNEENGRLKREFRVSPGADPSQIELLYEGENGPHVDGDGVLRFASPAGEMLESPLVCWQVIGDERIGRAAEYVVDDGSVRIRVAEYDAGYELTIDPELVYSSYLGGSDSDYSYSLAGDGAGGVWVTGHTASPDFPVLDGSNGTWGHIAFVSHFASNGTLLSSTCLGGSAADYADVLVADDSGGVWVLGVTTSTDFPILNEFQDTYGGGGGDAFVSHFSSSGALLSSTYLGGGGIELDNALVGDGAGGVWVAGFTTSTNFPVTEDAYQSSYGGGDGDAFVSHFSSTGVLLFSTYLGGEGHDYGSALADDGAGGVWVMGGTQSTDFPTLNAYQRLHGGEWDVFVSHFASNGTLLLSTYMGGTIFDRGSALAGDGNGGVWVTGETWSSYVPDICKSFPILNAYQGTYGGERDAFVSRFASNGTLLLSTYLGGSEYDSGYAVTGDGAGGVWVTGYTRSANFPIQNASQSTYGGGSLYGDLFVSHLSPDGALLSSTYLGGEEDDCDSGAGREDDHRYTLVGDGDGGVWVTGSTTSTTFPVLNAFQNTYGGGTHDAFVSHFSSSGTLLLSTYLGGGDSDYGNALAGDGAGGVWVTGYTGSPNFPTLRGYQDAYGGSTDIFVAKFAGDVPVHPPVTDFTANVTAGPAPLAVRFTDTSVGDPIEWIWDFGDDASSIEQNPVHIYRTPGTYTVSLTATNAAGSNTGSKSDYIRVVTPPPVANFTANVTGGLAPLAVQFTDTSTGNPTGRAWFFGDETYDRPWTCMNASAGWTERENTAVVAMPDGSIVLMGGWDDDYEKDDVWRSDDYGATWMCVNASAAWSNRYGHAAVTIGNSILLMGGLGDGLLNDVWRSDDYGATWGCVNASAGWTERRSHACVVMPDDSIVLMGGWDAEDGPKGDVWRSSDGGATWMCVNASAGWEGRQYHTSVALPSGSIILMGGWSNSGYLNDVWRSDDYGATWICVNASAGWTERESPVAVAMPDGSIVLMGGFDNDLTRNDAWRSTDGGTTWTQLPDADWTARKWHSSAVLPDGSILVMGGTPRGSDRLNDVWRLQTAGSLIQNPVHTYTVPGTYKVTLLAYNANGCSTTQGSITVKISLPIADFTANVTAGPAPLAVRFTDLSTGDPTGWSWSFGDGNTSTEQNPVHTYT
ncbi:MAG: PKD domain-containing protein, partial [Methanoculleus sp.]|nr:PKD domain-containing protein [Methanoculleus sp.]